MPRQWPRTANFRSDRCSRSSPRLRATTLRRPSAPTTRRARIGSGPAPFSTVTSLAAGRQAIDVARVRLAHLDAAAARLFEQHVVEPVAAHGEAHLVFGAPVEAAERRCHRARRAPCRAADAGTARGPPPRRPARPAGATLRARRLRHRPCRAGSAPRRPAPRRAPAGAGGSRAPRPRARHPPRARRALLTRPSARRPAGGTATWPRPGPGCPRPRRTRPAPPA